MTPVTHLSGTGPAANSQRLRAAEGRRVIRPGAGQDRRAISVPHRHQDAGRAVVIVSASAFGFDMSVDAVGNDSVRAARLVLVDQRGPLAVMPHPGHQILDPRAARSSKGVTGMAKVVEVQTLRTDRHRRMRPPRHLAEIAPPYWHPTDPREHQRAGFRPNELGHVLLQSRNDRPGREQETRLIPGSAVPPRRFADQHSSRLTQELCPWSIESGRVRPSAPDARGRPSAPGAGPAYDPAA